MIDFVVTLTTFCNINNWSSILIQDSYSEITVLVVIVVVVIVVIVVIVVKTVYKLPFIIDSCFWCLIRNKIP
jgi:hypothetical protein